MKKIVRFLGRLVKALIVVVGLLISLGIITGITAWITMRRTISGREVTVPSLEGREEAEAKRLLGKVDLSLVVRSSLYDDEVPEGTVLKQEPSAGQTLKSGTRVYVVLSLGKKKVTIPELAGSAMSQARARLEEAGIELGVVVRAPSSTVMEGAVISNEPEAGSPYFEGQPVTLLVSSGPEEVAFVMPDLIGLDVTDVEAFLRGAGLRLGDVSEGPYEGLAPGIIIRQRPKAGSRVAAHDIISLGVVAGEREETPATLEEAFPS